MSNQTPFKINYIKKSVEYLNTCRDAYYNTEHPLISDSEYDKRVDELSKLEKETGFILFNSPTQQVGYEVKTELKKVKHTHLMLSLDKTKSVDDLVKFVKTKPAILSLKMDGLTICLTYENGKLIKAETRGNGEIGEDITHNAKAFMNIPLSIPYTEHIEFEGEAIITYDDFEKINNNLSANETPYANPRNLAAGSVRLLDSNIVATRKIRFICWKVLLQENEFNSSFNSFQQRLSFAEELGFDIVPIYFIQSDSNRNHISTKIHHLKKIAELYQYPIDGLVITYENIEYGNSLGMTSHHPKHSLAFKFKDDCEETTLINVNYQVGKTGVLTPVAMFEPVDIDGSTISCASVHNITILKELDLHQGDKITVYKANAIIPQIQENLSLQDRVKIGIEVPPICPFCKSPTEIYNFNGIETLYCVNENCSGRLISKLTHFVSKECFNIDGLSTDRLSFLHQNGFINSIVDIFKLKEHKTEILKFNGYGEKIVNKLLSNIEISRKITLDKFFNAMCIKGLGKEQSKALAKYCNYDYDEFVKLADTYCDFTIIDGFGVSINKSIYDWYENFKKSSDYEIFSYITIDKIEKDTNKTDNLKGLTFVITGSLETFLNRNEAKEKIEAHGGKVSSSVSTKTSYLVNNDIESTSSKNKKAKELGIPIINEKVLKEMIDNG